MFPHDEEDGGADEAELDGAGEEEGAAALVQVMHHLESNIKQVSQNWRREVIWCVIHLFLSARAAERNVADIDGVLIAHSHKVSLSPTISVAAKLTNPHQEIKHVLILSNLIRELVGCW